MAWEVWRLALCWLNAQAVADVYAALDMQHPCAYWADLLSAGDARRQMLA